ncbi:MAG: hypothetical protein DCC58_11100 [Chloroflexi bacterium]|nr:MAG: hypothetical protein DCC58_11100 [Chloroflexota bacterium]
MARTTLTREDALTLLHEQPERMATLTGGLSPGQLRVRPAPDEWSATELLAHLRACADVWGAAIATILAEDQPRIRAVDPRTWMVQTGYPDLAFSDSLAAYRSQRNALLATLGALQPEQWAREATVIGAGAPIQRSVLTFTTRLARHERTHMKQLAKIVAAVRR